MREIIDNLRSRLSLHEDYQAVFSSPAGQRVLSHILREGFVSKSTFVAGDPHMTSLNEGSRRLALSIYRFYAKDHKELQKMIDQANEHAATS